MRKNKSSKAKKLLLRKGKNSELTLEMDSEGEEMTSQKKDHGVQN